jgi:protein O-GlcNAc transferase
MGRTQEALDWYARAISLKPDFAEAHNNRGLLLTSLGRHREAVDAFSRAQDSRPQYWRAMNNMGLSQLALGDPIGALASFDAALRLQPDYLAALGNRAEALLELGQETSAQEAYERALRIRPDAWQLLMGLARTHRALGHPDMAAEYFERTVKVLETTVAATKSVDQNLEVALAEALEGSSRSDEALGHLETAIATQESAILLVSFGAVLARSGAHARSLAAFERAVSLAPASASAWLGLAKALEFSGNLDGAVEACEKALALDPQGFDAVCRLAEFTLRAGNADEALGLFNRAIALRPQRVDPYCRKASILQSLERHDEAADSYSRALTLRPLHKEALMGCATSLSALRRYEQAFTCLDEVLQIDPLFVPAMANWGAILADMGAYPLAIEQYDRALVIDPKAFAVLCNRGTAAMTISRFGVAAESFRRALAIAQAEGRAPEDISTLRSRLLDAKAASCDWEEFESLRDDTVRALKEGVDLSPFVAITFADDPALQLRVARNYAQSHYPRIGPGLAGGQRAEHERIRVAYLSADFHDHATAYLAAGLFEKHDRARFEITAVSFGPDDEVSEWRRRIRHAADRFVEVSRSTDAEIAAQLVELEIDIAVDLKGYTLGCRPGIFARRPAPIQVSYLGFPGTTGADYIDYVIADSVLVPPGAEIHYSEKVVRLPGSYQVNDDQRPIENVTPSRLSQSLPDDAVVFCTFNNSYKITPEMFSVWMRILTRSPGAVLWQLQRDPSVRENLRHEAERRGVAGDRLIFAEPLPASAHLARMRCADLFLDTLPVNAHTTASDALWTGLPILTQQGKSFAGRVCSSLLHAMGLEELVAASASDYEEMAVALATDPERLASLKSRVQANRARSPLFDTARFCGNVEAAYVVMWQRLLAGEPPAHIAFPPVSQS